MSETRKPGADHPITQPQRDLAAFDARLSGEEPSTDLVPAGGDEMIPIDDDVLFPELIVGQLFEFAQHPERHTEAELQAAVDKAELLLQKLELRAKMATPKALPKITYVLCIFIPEFRKQLAEYSRRKQQAAELVDQKATIEEALQPIITSLQREIFEKKGTVDTTVPKTEESIRKKERFKLLEREWENIVRFSQEPLLENPVLITYIPHRNDSLAAAGKVLKNSRISSYEHYNNGNTNTFEILDRFVTELNQSLQHANISVDYKRDQFGNEQYKYDDSGRHLYNYYNIQSLVVKIKVAIAEYKEVLEASKVD